MNRPDDLEGRYAFGPFQLDLARRRLTRGDAILTVTPTVLDVLICLVRNAGRIVTKDELLTTVWPGRIVEEANVKQAIFTLRKLLGAEGDLMIATVSGRGYRFAEHVQRVEFGSGRATGAGVEQPFEAGRTAWWPLALVALGFLAVAGIVAARFWHAPAPVEQNRTIVIADFENRTGDPIFDRTLANLLRIDLSQSPFLNVISEKQAQLTLKLMTKSADTPVTPALAEEICTRNNGDAVLRGGIASFGARYLLVLMATDCSGGRELVAEKDEVVGKAGIAPALDGLIARVRSKLGESAGSIQKFNIPLLGEQTASLDALKAYSEAKWLFDHGRQADAIPLDKQAIELDPRFSAAYANLGVIYAVLYDQKQTAENLSKAYALRNTVNEHERLRITALYDQFVTGDFNEAIRNFQAWTTIYPQDVIGWSNLANAEDYIGRHDQAIVDADRALALKPAIENPYVVLARAEMEAGHADAGYQVATLAVTRGIAGDSTHRELLRIADLRQDVQSIRREEDWANSVPSAPRTQEVEAEILLSRGQAGAAAKIFDEISRAILAQETHDHELPVHARLLAEMGLTQQAANLIAPLHDDMAPDPDYILALARVSDPGRAEQLMQSWLRTSPLDTLLHNVYAPEVEAFLALRRGDPKGAVVALQPAMPFASRTLDVPYLLGVAYLAAGNGPQAQIAFSVVLAHRGWAPESVLYPLAKLGLARALWIEHKVPASAAAYRSFLSDWHAADSDVPVFSAARAEYAVLTRLHF